MDTAVKSLIGAPGFVDESTWIGSDGAADDAAGYTPSLEIIQSDVEACVLAGIPRERAERLMGLKK